MKKLLLLAFTLLIFTFSSTAQNFAPVGSEWHYTNIESWYLPNLGYEKITSVADTVINGKPSRHLQRTLHTTWAGVVTLPDVFLHSSGDTVFMLGNNGDFFVLYNFAAEIGDSWVTRVRDPYINGDTAIAFTVIEKATETINGQVLRKLKVQPDHTYLSFGNTFIFEKMGNSYYMFPQNYAFGHDDIRAQMRCYSDPLFGSYQAPGVTDCTAMVTSSSDNIFLDPIKLYPNPATDILQINLLNDMQKVEVINTLGAVMSIQTCSQNCSLNVQDLPKGLYLIRITDEKKQTRISKFVKAGK